MIDDSVYRLEDAWLVEERGPLGSKEGRGGGGFGNTFSFKTLYISLCSPYSDFTLTPHDGIWRHILYQVSVTKNTEKS